MLTLSVCVCVFVQEEQAAKLKADNIRVALEKIKEAQVKKVSEEKENEAAKNSTMRPTRRMQRFSAAVRVPHVFWVRSVSLHIESSGQ